MITTKRLNNIIEERKEKNPNKKYTKIYQKNSMIGIHVMVCPKCDDVCASASERMYLPEFTSCDNINCNY